MVSAQPQVDGRRNQSPSQVIKHLSVDTVKELKTKQCRCTVCNSYIYQGGLEPSHVFLKDKLLCKTCRVTQNNLHYTTPTSK